MTVSTSSQNTGRHTTRGKPTAARAGAAVAAFALIAACGACSGGQTHAITAAAPGSTSVTSSSTVVTPASTVAPTTTQVFGGTITGDLVLKGSTVATFTLRSDGSYSFINKDGRSGEKRDRSTDTLEILSSSAPSIRNIGLPFAGPDADSLDSSWNAMTSHELAASAVNEIALGRGTKVASTTVVSGNKTNAVSGQVTALSVTVDSSTGLATRVSEGGQVSYEIQNLVQHPGSGDLPSPIPTGASVKSGNAGPFKMVSPNELASTLPYKPVTITFPAGYGDQLTQVGLGDEGPVGLGPDPTSEGSSNPDSKDVMIVAQRSGYRELVLTTRQANPNHTTQAPAWGDIYRYFIQPTVQDYVPGTGAGRGVTFHVVSGLGITPHAWGILGDVVVTVGGDVSVAQIKAALDSMTR